jgi:hypothetical protein
MVRTGKNALPAVDSYLQKSFRTISPRSNYFRGLCGYFLSQEREAGDSRCNPAKKLEDYIARLSARKRNSNMHRRRRAEIMIEIDRTIVYTRRYARQPHWCESCAAEVEMITAFEAARLAGMSSYTIFARAEAGEIHSTVTAEGVLLLCIESLSS